MRLWRKREGWTLARAPVSKMPSTASQQRADIRDVRRAREHQRQRPGNLGHRAQVSLADAVNIEAVFDPMRIARSRRRLVSSSSASHARSWRRSPKRLIQPAQRLLEYGTRRRKIEAQPGLATRSKL